MLSIANVKKQKKDFYIYICAKIFIPGSYKLLSIIALPDKLKGGSPYMGISPASTSASTLHGIAQEECL